MKKNPWPGFFRIINHLLLYFFSAILMPFFFSRSLGLTV